MKGGISCAVWLAVWLLVAARPSVAHRIVEYEDLEAPLRVIIGVPGNRPSQREYIQEMVKEHVAAAQSSSQTVDYTFLSQDDSGFDHLFPKHSGPGALALPAIRLMNSQTGDFMSPDWAIPSSDFSSELNRLVGEFLKWQLQTDEVKVDEDEVLLLHGKNMPFARVDHENLLVMFYAPWCKYSQAMLPKFAQAKQMVDEMVRDKVLPRDAAVGKVNVDEEGQLRKDFNVSMYPSFKFLKQGSPPLSFRGQAETATDLVAHFITATQSGETITTPREGAAFASVIAGLNKLLAGDSEAEESAATVVLAVTASSHNALGPCSVANAIQGKATISACVAPSVARGLVADELLPLFPAASTVGAAAVPEPKEGQVLVLTEHNGLLASPVFTTSQEELLRWSLAATWPTVSRFDGSASQGDRIRNSPMTTLVLLAADEKDIMFPEFKTALATAANDRRGMAHFLFADKNEPRIQGILGSAGAASASSFPAVVLLSLAGEFDTVLLSKEDVTKAKIVRALDSLLRMPAHDRRHGGEL